MSVQRPSECGTHRSQSSAGYLFGPSGESDWWDKKCLFHPIVVEGPASSEWRMYYYGRETDAWRSGVSPALISSGRIGMSWSRDGISWTRVRGPLPQGAIMDPREGSAPAFDCVHVGCSDVFFHEGNWWMYYFGGGLEITKLLTGKCVKGMRLRTGLARSPDGIHGFNHTREDDAVLDVGRTGNWDEHMAAWARVIPPSKGKKARWLMSYASMDLSTIPAFSIGVAVSQDGLSWTKLGKALERGEPGTWDDAGVSRRHIVFWDGQYLMFYEGVSKRGMHGIGLAISYDGITWVKDQQGPDGETGGPIFTARSQIGDAWDAGGVASPHVVRMMDNSFKLYYVGSDSSKKVNAMGLAVSDGSDYRRWRRYGM